MRGSAVNMGWLTHTHTHTHTHRGGESGLVVSFINELCCAGRAAVMTLQNQGAVTHTHKFRVKHTLNGSVNTLTVICMNKYGLKYPGTP